MTPRHPVHSTAKVYIGGDCPRCGAAMDTYRVRNMTPHRETIRLCARCVQTLLVTCAVRLHYPHDANPVLVIREPTEASHDQRLAEIGRRAQVCPLCGGGPDGRRCICHGVLDAGVSGVMTLLQEGDSHARVDSGPGRRDCLPDRRHRPRCRLFIRRPRWQAG